VAPGSNWRSARAYSAAFACAPPAMRGLSVRPNPVVRNPSGSISRVCTRSAHGFPAASSAMRPATWNPAPPSMKALPGGARSGSREISCVQPASVAERVSRQSARAGSPEVWARSIRSVMPALSFGQSVSSEPAGVSSVKNPSLTRERMTSVLSSFVPEAIGTASAVV